MIFSISSIYASDMEWSHSEISSVEDCGELVCDNQFCSDLSFSDGVDGIVGSCEDDGFRETASGGDFDELCEKINNTPQGGILVLDKDYKYANGSNGGSNKGIVISKSSPLTATATLLMETDMT